ncbi:MAG: hypothetical protein CMQ38_05775 [Gammaproteobacteria bacterium]|nr:hypothetical protein [Gammaproteobacteria bacterium]
MVNENQNSGGLVSGAFDLLRYGIGRHYDAEQREAVIVNDETDQYQLNESNQPQRVGTIGGFAPLESMPDWARYTLYGSVALLGVSAAMKVAGLR